MKKNLKYEKNEIHCPSERARVGLKVCGMKYRENIIAVSKLQPNYLGFIFYEKSPRNFDGTIPEIDSSIKKVGVFVNASIDFILDKVAKYNFDAIQLHGTESPQYCQKLKLKSNAIKLIKIFSIKDDFDFKRLKPYEDYCSHFLFDTKGKLPGGNGYTFDWKILEDYPSTKPFFLSGGIGLDSIENLKAFFKTDASKYCEVIDVNSRFEVKEGLKDVELISQFKRELKQINNC